MNWTYFWGILAIAAIVGISFTGGWSAGFGAGRKKGFYEGWDDGCDYTKTKIEKERLAEPFRKRLNQANRKTIPRPDSAGPVRIHRASLRGDYRLPTNKTVEEQRRNLQNNPTKLSPKPLEDDPFV